MKTLFVSHAAALGGAELYLLDYLTCGHREGKVVLFAEGAFAESLRAAGVNAEVLAAPGDLLAVARETPGRRGGGVAGGVLGLARRLAREAGGFDLLFANSQKAFVVGALAALFARRPIVWCLHDILSAEHFSAANRRLVISLANLTGALVVANSRATADAFVRSGGRAARVRVVYNGIDVDAFREPLEPAAGRAALRDELGVGSAPLVGLFSRLSAWKGQHVLLEALAELPGTHAVLVGDALFGEDAYAASLGADLAERVPLGELGLLHPREHTTAVGDLSLGQRRRLALAVAVADAPDLLLLDEPTNHVSLRLAGELEEALGTAPGTVVVTSHDRWLRRRWLGPELVLGAA